MNEIPTAGTTARFDLANGDSYIGEVTETGRDIVVLRNYGAWYDGDAAPYSSPHIDDEVSFQVDHKTKISTF